MILTLLEELRDLIEKWRAAGDPALEDAADELEKIADRHDADV